MIRSLRAKIIALTLALSLLPLLLLSAALLGMSYTSKRNDVLTRQQDNAQWMARHVAEMLGQSEQVMSVLAQTANWQALTPAEQNLIVDTLYAYRLFDPADNPNNPWTVFTEILFLDQEGEPVVGKSAFRMLLLKDWADLAREAAFGTVKQGQSYWGPVYFGAADMPALDIAVPTRDLAGNFTGMLWGSIDLDKALWSEITGLGVSEDALLYLFDESGRLIVRSDEHFYERSDLPAAIVPVARTQQGELNGVGTYTGLTGEKVVGAWQPVGDMGWTVVVETPTRVAFADIRKLSTLALIVSAATIGVALVAGVFASQSLIRPLETLRQGAETIGAGNLEHRIQVRSQDEIGDLAQAFNQMAASLKTSQAEIEQWSQELETRVEERTRELAETSERTRRRAAHIQASAEVARAIASVRDLEQLLPQITQLISQRFGWYHVGIFLLDEQAEYAVLEAANSTGGQLMLARGHRLKVGETGIVGSVTSTGEPLIALDVGENAVYFDTPELHSTRSEMALPLKIGDRIIGALDVQSTEAAAYDDQDVTLLAILADQVAIALENARLFEQTQRALDEVQTLHRQYVEREWTRKTTQQRDLAYEYRRRGLPPLGEALPPEAELAVNTGQVATFTRPPAGQPGDEGGNGYSQAVQAALAAPIKIRDQVIGVLDLQEADAPRQWTNDDIALVQSISDQIGLALENARLFEQTQSALQETEELYRAGVELNAAQTYDQILSVLRAHTLLGQADRNVSLNLFDRPWVGDDVPEWSIPVARWGKLPPDAVRPRYPLRAFPSAARLLSADHPTLISDVATEPLMDDKARYLYQQIFQAGSTLFAPLAVGGEWIGYVNVIYGQPTEFPEASVRRLMTLVGQAAVVVQNLRHLQEIEARARREALIREIGAKVSRSMDLETVLQTSIRELGQALGAPQAMIRMGAPPDEETPAAPIDE